MQKWEYCAIGPVKWESGQFAFHYPNLFYFTLDGIKKVNIQGGGEVIDDNGKKDFVNEKKLFSITLTKLGLEGWEMVGTGAYNREVPGNSNEFHMIYFKRPIED